MKVIVELPLQTVYMMMRIKREALSYGNHTEDDIICSAVIKLFYSIFSEHPTPEK